MRFLIVFLFMFHVGVFSQNFFIPKNERPFPTAVALSQIEAFEQAINSEDKNAVMKLFDTVEADALHVDKLIIFIKKIKVKISVYTAKYIGKNKIEADMRVHPLRLRRASPAKWLLVKSTTSPTGWKIGGIQQGQTKKTTWDWCYLGIIECFNEYISRISSGDY